MIIRLKDNFFKDVVPFSYTSRSTTSWEDVRDYIKDTNPTLIVHNCTYSDSRTQAYVVRISSNNDANLTWFMLKYSEYLI